MLRSTCAARLLSPPTQPSSLRSSLRLVAPIARRQDATIDEPDDGVTDASGELDDTEAAFGADSYRTIRRLGVGEWRRALRSRLPVPQVAMVDRHRPRPLPVGCVRCELTCPHPLSSLFPLRGQSGADREGTVAALRFLLGTQESHWRGW